MNTLNAAGCLVAPLVIIHLIRPLAAQGPGLPTYHRFTTRGLGVAVDYGRAGPNVPNNFNAWGMAATFAFGPRIDSTLHSGLYNVGVAVSQTVIGGRRITVGGVQAGLVMDYIHVGWMRWDSAGVGRWRAPIGYGGPFIWCTSPSFAIRVWGGARLDIDHRSGSGSNGQQARTIARPGFVLGLHFQLANGLGVHAAGDNTRLANRNDWIVGVGVHYARRSLSHATTVAPGQRCGFFLAPS